MPRDEFEYHETNLNTTSRICIPRYGLEYHETDLNMLAVLAATIHVVGRCLGLFIYVCGVAACITADGVPQPTTSQTENRELENCRKFSLNLSEVGYRFKGSHKQCKTGPLAGLQ